MAQWQVFGGFGFGQRAVDGHIGRRFGGWVTGFPVGCGAACGAAYKRYIAIGIGAYVPC